MSLEPSEGAEAPRDGDASRVLAELGARHDAIAERLREARSDTDHAAVKGEIVAFFREVDALHESVGRLRERIRALVDEYRATGAGARRPVVHSDGLNASSFVERGWNFIAAEKNEEAVEALEKALALSPDSLEAEGLLGWALMKAGRYDRALRSLERVLRANPANEMARVNLGYICLKRKIYGEALAHLSGVLEQGRDKKARLYAMHYLGLLHAERGDADEALNCFRSAVEAGPNLIEAYYHMGLLLYRQQKPDEARAVWQSAVSQNPYNPYSKHAKTALERLEAGLPVEPD
jgi:tetratricopeptide (TPR) repeat protein